MNPITVSSWLNEATEELKVAGIDSARLDAELILSHTLRKPRTYLHAHNTEKLDDRQIEIANARLDLRVDRTPVAYIIGHKEFYGRRFTTTPAALIPRPESEAIIDIVKSLQPTTLPLITERKTLVDVGTGTGCLGITAKLEWPELDVTLTDISQHALTLAKKNAELLQATVHFHKGDLLRGYGSSIDIILANLPYVDRKWEVSPETHAEPELALYASDQGLALIRELVNQSAQLLTGGGSLILESDERQHAAIIQMCQAHGLRHRESLGLITHFIKQ
jgi:release factor glutamine methyltransferase